jgi:hypothetical protein
MTDFNLHRNLQGCWEWEHDGKLYGTDPNGMGMWHKLAEPRPHTILLHGKYAPGSIVIQEWEQLINREDFHLEPQRSAALNHLRMLYE